jgi:tetratricopeptide (TPR) repeat protein
VSGPQRDGRVPAFLGRILDEGGAPAGTCFQLRPGIVATAWHVLASVGAREVGDGVQIDALGGDIGPLDATVHAIDELADLAVLDVAGALGASVAGFRATDDTPIGRDAVATGVSKVEDGDHEYRFIDAPGTWAGGTTRDDRVPLGRFVSADILPGMSGAPLRQRADDFVVGVVSGRYNSADGWLKDSVWIARTEQLEPLCAGLAEIDLGRSAATEALDLTLEVTTELVSLRGSDRPDATGCPAGLSGALVGAIDDVRRARARVGGTRQQAHAELARGEHGGLARAGRLLAEAFLPDEVRLALDEALSRAERGNQAVRIGIVCDGDLARLPWEALVDLRTGRPLSLHPLTSVYRCEGGGTPAAVPGPLRILVAISSPDRDGGPVLDYERELRNVVAAGRAARLGAAHVRVVPFATTAAIRSALDAERVHVLHLSGHGGPGRFVFEGDAGVARDLDADRFVDEAIPPGAMPAVIALAACHANVAEAGGAPSFARRLLARGASAVIATETSVTDVYATRVFSRVYGNLADATVPDVVRAVSDARRTVQAEFQRTSDVREQRLAELDEWAVLSVLAGQGAVAAFDPSIVEPPPPGPPRFAIGSVAGRAVGDFVGRRREQRQWPIELVADGTAGLVLHGIGGVGKTTLAAELVGRVYEREPGRVRIVLEGELSAGRLIDAVTAGLRQRALVSGQLHARLGQILVTAAQSDLPWADRWAILRDEVLGALPVLLVLDNFEDNLVDEGGRRSVRDPALAELLATWAEDPRLSRLLITCRYPFKLPRSTERRLAFKPVGPLSLAETYKLLWSLPALDRLEPAETERIWRLVGGHPRSLEYLDALLSQGAGRYADITARLTSAVTSRLGSDAAERFLTSERTLDEALAEVATIAADDVLLAQLLRGLDAVEGARALLVGMSVYREPVDLNAILYQVGAVDEAVAHDAMTAVRRIGEILVSAGVDMSAKPSLEDLPEEIRARVAPYLRDARRPSAPPRSRPSNLAAAVDACVVSSLLSQEATDEGSRFFVHRWTATELDRSEAAAGRGDAVLVAHDRAADYWRWRVSHWPQSARSDVHDLLEARHHHLEAGKLELAAEVVGAACSRLDTWGAWDDEEALARDMLARFSAEDDQVAPWIGRLGSVALRRGEVVEAERLYRRSLEIAERVGDQPGMGSTYHQLGLLAQRRGEVVEAERLYRLSLEIAERVGVQQGMASIYHQLGMLAQDRGDVAEAEQLYRQSLQIEERVGNQPGMAISYHQLGVLAQLRGDVAEAERLYRQSLQIEERVGNQPGMASSYHQLGMVAQDRGDVVEAERLYRLSLEIAEQIGDQPGMASSLHQLGMVAQVRGDIVEAERLYRQALEIKERVGDQPDMTSTLHQLGILAQVREDVVEAERLYRQALEIRERVGDQPGMASSYHQLGMLAQGRGEMTEAERLYRQSLQIEERVGNLPGIAISYRQLARLADSRGNAAEAKLMRDQALAVEQRLEELR